MRSYVAKRILQCIPTLLGVTIITFCLMQLAPGDPMGIQFEGEAQAYAQESIEEWRTLKGLNKPLGAQYVHWLKQSVQFDFGRSLVDERPVHILLGEAFPKTLLLSGLSLLLIYCVSIPLGIFSALHRKTRLDRMLSSTLFVMYALPSFWVALILIMFFCGGDFLNWFPMRGLSSENMQAHSLWSQWWDHAWHLVLPVACLSYPALAHTSRFQRNAMLDVLQQDYIRTARLKGLSKTRIVWRHAFPNASICMITLLALDLPWVVSGSVIVEKIFTIRGMGMLTFDAILRRDYPVIMGIVTLVAVMTVLASLLADLAYKIADPRIRFSHRKQI